MVYNFKPKKCLICNKQFIPKTGIAKYCSKECGILFRKTQRIQTYLRFCKHCNKQFSTNHHSRLYCNNKCLKLSTKYKHKLNHKKNYIPIIVKKYCFNCNNLIPSKYAKKYCSKKCRDEYNLKLNTKTMICVVCKKGFKSTGRNTCSEKCKNTIKKRGHRWKMSLDGRKKISETRKKLIAEGKIKISPKSSRSKTVYYNNIMFRSPWESKVAKWLDKKNIRWEYENYKRKIILKNGSSYIVDFYLPDLDKYIEVKGWWDDYSINKCNELIKQKGPEKLLIVDKQNINNIDLNHYFFEISEWCNDQISINIELEMEEYRGIL